ncbi:MAG TPA: hypothetical protein VK428_14555 [Acidimicrobiales bacterium]|nr:hypothetical protein [Acidimicrobiales bacterium]
MTSPAGRAQGAPSGCVGAYLELGLALGRHVQGLVDAYYGPPDLAGRMAAEPVRPPARLVKEARRLLADLEAGAPLDADPAQDEPARRAWLEAQVRGLHTTARRLAGEDIAFEDEVEQCYAVRPRAVPEDAIAAAHNDLDAVLPGAGPLSERLIAWREVQAVAVDVLPSAIASLADDLRERTGRLIGLPEGERVDFELVNKRPWSGFNWYLGGLRSRVEINTDLPVLSTSLAHLVAHEAYPGHHTEHTRKEARLVRGCRRLEETIFLVGTPEATVSEGLADLGLEVVVGRRPEAMVAEHLRPLGIRYDAEVVAAVAEAGQLLSDARGNAALRLHAEGADPDAVIDELARWALLPRPRAAKVVEFLVHPTFRAYVFCYIEGLRACRRFADGDAAKFQRLVTEQLTPHDLGA